MSTVNHYTKEISIKIVYYGPGLGGKTSSLQHIHRALKAESRGQLVSLSTGSDRTLYFDFLPMKLPKLRGYAVRVQLYTVPGQVHYNSTRKLVLTGVDGIVFVADSQAPRREANIESLDNLAENLREQGAELKDVPHLFQYNKRDAQAPMELAAMNADLNHHVAPVFETSATNGLGVFEALKSMTTMVLSDLRRRGVWQADAETPASATRDDRTPTSDGSIAQSLQALAESAPADLDRLASDLKPLEPEETKIDGGVLARGAALSEILPPGPTRDAITAVEYFIHRGDFTAAIAHANKIYQETALARASEAGIGQGEAPTVFALMLGITSTRYLRFRNTVERAQTGGASSADALFTLFFLVDVALR